MDCEKTIEIVIDNLDPIGKPRMTQRDKWQARPAVARYRAFKDELILRAREQGYRDDLDVYRIEVEAFIQMPRSWSNKKSESLLWNYHRQKPDADNILKAVVDSLLIDDAKVGEMSIQKYWSQLPLIKIKIYYNQKGDQDHE